MGGDFIIGALPGEFLLVREMHEELGVAVGDAFIRIRDYVVKHRYLVESFPFIDRHGFDLLLGAEGSTA
jgi:hypothetical protein